MHGVEAHVGMWVQNAGARDPCIDEAQEPHPGQPPTLAAAPKRPIPAPDDLSPKAVETIHVAGHGVVVEVALDNGSQPSARRRHRLMPASAKRVFDGRQLGGEAPPDGLALDDEPAGLPRGAADVGEPEEVERVRLALAARLSVVRCGPPEFNQARLVRVQGSTNFFSHPWSRSATSRLPTIVGAGRSHPHAVERGTPRSAAMVRSPVRRTRSRNRWSYRCCGRNLVVMRMIIRFTRRTS
jgi:hypothetical protein